MEVRGTLHFDGASRGNPGPSGAGVLLVVGGREVALAEPLPHIATSNVAEYHALILGLRLARRHGVTDLVVLGDSQLVIEQMKGAYRVKTPHLVPLRAEAARVAGKFAAITYQHVPRAQNALADRQSNLGADEAAAKAATLVPFEAWKRATSHP